jgi:YhcH/YjgK/YiaL family protein
MILDDIRNLSRYNIPMAAEISAYLQATDLLALDQEEIVIDGRRLFVRPSVYTTRPATQANFETHQVYADLQYVVDGVEVIQLVSSEVLAPLTEYDSQKDIRFFSAAGQPTDLVVKQGFFVFLYPGEAHRPCCQYMSQSTKVRKLVFKIRMN